MIDREARAKMSEAMRSLAAGLISNDQFESAMPQSLSDDAAIQEVFSNGAWTLYSDMREYRLNGKYRLDAKTKSEVARWILFLQTDLPYEWPIRTISAALKDLGLSLITFGFYRKRCEKQFRSAGDIEVWPFIRKSDYENALKHPRYLTNAL